MDLNLTRVRRFLAIYRNESFARAAAELGVTHSALTKSLQQLEQELGTALFDRTTRVVTATEAGHRLALRGAELLAFAGQVSEELASGARHIRLIAGPAVIEASLASALAAFHKRHPDVRVSAETMPPDLAFARLRRREVELLLYHSNLIGTLPDRQSFRIAQIIDEPYVAVLRADHPVLQTDCSPEALLNQQWAIPGYDPLYRSAIPVAVEERYRRASFPHYRVLSLSACLALAADGDLISLLPEPFVRAQPAARNFVTLPMPLADGARYTISAIGLASAPPDPLLDALVKLIAAQGQSH
jgi:LysR family transcriptional regulator of abg operon